MFTIMFSPYETCEDVKRHIFPFRLLAVCDCILMCEAIMWDESIIGTLWFGFLFIVMASFEYATRNLYYDKLKEEYQKIN